MPFDTIESIVEQASEMDIPSIGIIGGEPLLYPKVFDLLKNHKNTGFYIATNGTLVTREVAEKLKSLPHVIIAFSVDGFEEINDRFRGRGVFQKIVRSMVMLKEAGVAFGFSTTVHRGNLADVISERYLDFMIDNGCLFGAFLPYVPVGTDPKFDLVCGESEVNTYYMKIDEMTSKKGILILKEGYSDGTFLNSGCGAGHTLHITSSGEVEPCNGIQFFKDNIHTSKLRDIFMSPYFQDIRRLHPPDHRECLVIARPAGVMEVVKKHQAAETHAEAAEHLEAYVASSREGVPD
jgi:MoaA/NifB/PqqE/SkfB family radical SAM enzyme